MYIRLCVCVYSCVDGGRERYLRARNHLRWWECVVAPKRRWWHWPCSTAGRWVCWLCCISDGCGVIVSRPSQTALGSSEDGIVFCEFMNLISVFNIFNLIILACQYSGIFDLELTWLKLFSWHLHEGFCLTKLLSLEGNPDFLWVSIISYGFGAFLSSMFF